ncbi:hypothetical protein F8M41_008924 [Gigaspora margarita]|uniref:Uncharacterized protein n=1 Tax=Gigaspora margarita TaxID=4874 RepID=A0A8H3X2X9_GIGMA|nr:hypothetical protein F8M41_008924 [Gigaspora margarita]
MKKAIKKNSSKSKSSHCKTKLKSKSRPEGSLLCNKTKKKKSGQSKCVNAYIILDKSSSDSSDSKNSTTLVKMNLKPIPWHVYRMNQDLVPLRLVNLVIQKAISQRLKAMPF